MLKLPKILPNCHNFIFLHEINAVEKDVLPRYAMLAWYVLCVCLSLSQASIVPKWLNMGSQKQRHTIAQGLWFSGFEDLCSCTLLLSK